MKSDIFFERLRKKEFSRLDKSGHVYLDYTGGNLYPQSLVEKHHRFLQKAVYGNPHSKNGASLLSEKYINESRKAVLDFFNAKDYYCIFTSNASAALQIVGECYPFSGDSHFLLLADNHNSVNGIREYCNNKGGAYTYSPMNYSGLSINEPELVKLLEMNKHAKEKLFAYPAQSNASGVQHSLEWIKKAHTQGWDVLLDASAFVPTSKLDLSVHSPEFATLSFYKMFGYPTGIGCLLVKKTVFNKLKKPWFAGGTVTLSAIQHSAHFLKNDHEKFENGTVNYLDIPAIVNGLNFIEGLKMENINARIKDLCSSVLSVFTKLTHHNGKPLIKLYGPSNVENRGGTFLINFLDQHGQQYPVELIEQMANANKISIRTGCFCNPGVDELNHSVSADLLRDYFVCRKYGDYDDMTQFLGKRRGAVRISIGIATTSLDIKKFILFGMKLLNKIVPAHALNV
jgi:selenocysteine lyase/cysteine desulfurase